MVVTVEGMEAGLNDARSATPAGLPSGFGPSGRAGAPPVQRIRVTFQKGRALRFIGHLDVVRMWERTFRRARLPLAYTLGFTPHPRLTFAAPLALGATGNAEIMDVYLREAVEPAALVERVAAELPGGCSIVQAEDVALLSPAVSSLVRWAEYRVDVVAGTVDTAPPADGAVEQGSRWSRRLVVGEAAPTSNAAGVDGSSQLPPPGSEPRRPPAEQLPPALPPPPLPPASELHARIGALLAAGTLPRERHRDGKRTTYDLRPLVRDLWLEPPAADTGSRPAATSPARAQLGMILKLDPTGTGRPDEVADALGLHAHAIERVRIDLEGDPPPRHA